MTNPKSMIAPDGEVRELDKTFFAKGKRGRPPMPQADRKKRVNLMLDQDVIERLKAHGNMSGEANEILREKLGL